MQKRKFQTTGKVTKMGLSAVITLRYRAANPRSTASGIFSARNLSDN